MQNHLEEKGFDSLVDHSFRFYGQKSTMRIYKDACKVVYVIKKASDEAEGNFGRTTSLPGFILVEDHENSPKSKVKCGLSLPFPKPPTPVPHFCPN